MSSSSANAAAFFVERHIAEGRAEKPAFIEGERRLTYGALAEQSARMAGLFERHGLRQEDRVAMLVEETEQLVFLGLDEQGPLFALDVSRHDESRLAPVVEPNDFIDLRSVGWLLEAEQAARLACDWARQSASLALLKAHDYPQPDGRALSVALA